MPFVLHRIAAIATDLSQLFVTAFGGGNGDPEVLRTIESVEARASKKTAPNDDSSAES